MILCKLLIGYMKKVVDNEKGQNPIDKTHLKYIIDEKLKKNLILYIWSLFVTSQGGVEFIHKQKQKAFPKKSMNLK